MLFSEMLKKAKSKIPRIDIKADFEVNNICYNSKLAAPNDIFFAVKGYNTDGNQFIKEALEKGAKAVFTDVIPPSPELPVYKTDDCRKTMAVFSNVLYDFPSEKMNMIGVTGTNGKTTVTSLINHTLEFAGKKTGLIGTNQYVINKRALEATHTTPESVDLNALLFMMNRENVEFVTMEVSSHSLSLKRVYDIDFDSVVFTNLSPEHLDFHKDMNEYFKVKKNLFDSAKKNNAKNRKTFAVYNIDDYYGEKIVRDTLAEKISYGFNDADYKAANLTMSFNGMRFDIITANNIFNINTKLTGRFNVYNILASIAVLRTFEIPYDIILSAIETFQPVEGRFNLIKLRNGASAIIDYSHTPDSLYNALLTIRQLLEQSGRGRIITVFGCGGNRDKSKRPKMGQIASENSTLVLITSDNPRYEEASSIIEDIKSGISLSNYLIKEDRKAAIEQAIELSKKGDVILIAGKGHETYQEIKGVKFHLSDREIVEKFC